MFISYIKNNVNIEASTCYMGLWGICIMEKILRKSRNMVSLDVYSDIIEPLKFLISYITIMIYCERGR